MLVEAGKSRGLLSGSRDPGKLGAGGFLRTRRSMDSVAHEDRRCLSQLKES